MSRDVVQAGSDIKAYLAGAPGGKTDEVTRAASMRDAAPQIEIPKASWSDFWGHYSQWKYGKVLLGTAGSWFFLDVAFCKFDPSSVPVPISRSSLPLMPYSRRRGLEQLDNPYGDWLRVRYHQRLPLLHEHRDWQYHPGLRRCHSRLLGHGRPR